jgi:hypothetical protein
MVDELSQHRQPRLAAQMHIEVLPRKSSNNDAFAAKEKVINNSLK